MVSPHTSALLTPHWSENLNFVFWLAVECNIWGTVTWCLMPPHLPIDAFPPFWAYSHHLFAAGLLDFTFKVDFDFCSSEMWLSFSDHWFVIIPWSCHYDAMQPDHLSSCNFSEQCKCDQADHPSESPLVLDQLSKLQTSLSKSFIHELLCQFDSWTVRKSSKKATFCKDSNMLWYIDNCGKSYPFWPLTLATGNPEVFPDDPPVICARVDMRRRVIPGVLTWCGHGASVVCNMCHGGYEEETPDVLTWCGHGASVICAR